MKGDEMEEKSTFVGAANLRVRRSLISFVRMDTVFNYEEKRNEIVVTIFYGNPCVLTKYENRHDGKAGTPYHTEISQLSFAVHFADDDVENARAFFDDVSR